MPNIGNVLREEIVRISRREIRKQTSALQSTSAKYRREIAALKRQISQLSADFGRSKRAERVGAAPKKETTGLRFVASGFRTLRHRLGLSANQMGKLLGVSEQSIYNWETKVSVPRRDKLSRIAELRGKGKRAVAADLEKL